MDFQNLDVNLMRKLCLMQMIRVQELNGNGNLMDDSGNKINNLFFHRGKVAKWNFR